MVQNCPAQRHRRRNGPPSYVTDNGGCWPSTNIGGSGIRFMSLPVGSEHTCGVELGTNRPLCWGENNDHQSIIPDSIKFIRQASCLTEHPELKGLSACTSCNLAGANPHFTIMDPKSNTGTCTSKECPTCKPSTCCGPRHKHYVLNSENLEGVCVRHTDPALVHTLTLTLTLII